MHTTITSREEILRVSRELIRQQGWPAVNIRQVAASCGVSIGSIYNYFGSKSELVAATVESVWQDIFQRPEAPFPDTEACVRWLYERMAEGGHRYPGFFSLHAMPFPGGEKAQGRQQMEQVWQHITDQLVQVLRRDPRVRSGAFTSTFTPEKFAGLLFSLLLAALIRGDYDPETVLETVRRTLY